MESRRSRSIPYRPWIDTGSTLDRPGSTLDRPRIYPTPNRSWIDPRSTPDRYQIDPIDTRSTTNQFFYMILLKVFREGV